MKKCILSSLYTITIFLISTGIARAQSPYVCGADQARQRLIQQHPEILQQEAELEQFTQTFVPDYMKYRDSRTGNIVIPVVFHILHQGGLENISDAQVIDEMRILNEDYNKRNADTSAVIPVFKPIIADVGIEFRLANIDPWGNCTNGIERINTCQTYSGNDYSKLNNWPRDKYLNVWVCRSMEDGVAGYAYYPGSVNTILNFPSKDGVIILHDYIGSIGTGNTTNCRALTHEVGHYLNLKHPWGDTNNPGVSCGDDDVNDTPITRGSNLNCNLNLNYCVAGTIENVQNYMDYSYCSKMFTNGQAARMMAALNSDKSNRDNLWTSGNLVATGTDDTVYNSCAPVADFSVNKKYICMGTTVTFLDAHYNGAVTDYYWEFPNGIPAISTDQNPQVQFQTAGWQPVRLTVSSPLGTSTKSDTFLVYVAHDNAMYPAPYFEDFEAPGKLNEFEWASVNVDKNETEFKQVDYASHWGNSCMQLNNYYTHADHDIDELVSPGFDLSQLSTANLTLSFYYSLGSWNQYFNSLNDSIAVLASANCGGNWVNIYKKGGSSIVNAGYQAGFFIPTQAQAFWKQVKINLPATLKQPNVHFKFQIFSAVYGNNFYIDDINIGNAVSTGIEEQDMFDEISLFPNPANDAAQLNIKLSTATDVEVKLFDVAGKQIASLFNGRMENGENMVALNNLGVFAGGVYVVQVKAGTTVRQQKLVIQ